MTDVNRYMSQIVMPEIGMEGQQKLSGAKVFVIGAGGLGCPLLNYLTAAGVGRIGIADDDKVSLANLHRQILYTESDIGKKKVDAAYARLSAMNNHVKFQIFPERVTASNSTSLIERFDIVADCSDNIETRYLVDEVCAKLNKPLVYAAIRGFEGQVSVFNYKGSPRFSDAFPDRSVFEKQNDCAIAGIVGVTAGVLGSMQACEVIKIIIGSDGILAGEVLAINLQTMQMRKLTF